MRFPSNRIFDVRNTSGNLANSTTSIVSQQTRKSSYRLEQWRHMARYENIRDWLLENLRNYCNTTSLHGFNHITRKGNTRVERLFWILIVIISIIVSIVLVIVSWSWNREIPTVTVIESSHFPTWNIPFPSITLCNFNKISKRRAGELIKTLKRPTNVTEEDLMKLFRITMFFSFTINDTNGAEFEVFNKILAENNMTLPQLAKELEPDCMDMISKCIWKGQNTRCDSLFQRILAAEGACCSFNNFGLSVNNFPPKIAYQVPKRPYRVTGCGYQTGLSVLLNPFADDYLGTYYSSYGFRMLIHDAYDFPDDNAETKVVTASRESFVRIDPQSTYATTDVKHMSLNMRNCLFANERRLAFMQRYSFINCMAECRINMLYKKCGCLPVSIPNNGSYTVCGFDQIDCVIQSKEVFARATPNFEQTLSMLRRTQSFPCGCMPDCESNQYPADITTGRLNSKFASNKMRIDTATNFDENILLHVFFSDLMSTRYRKEIFQNWLSSLASFGGLLGLIMGFSIVAAFEFLYFLTFRPVFNYFNN